MGTIGFWGLKKNGEVKMIHSYFDSYPSHLGKEVVSLIQNNLENLEKIFDKIILVKDIGNIGVGEKGFRLQDPADLLDEKIRERYFANSSNEFFERGILEYGYLIDLDALVLKLYKGKAMIAEIGFDKIKYRDVEQAFSAIEK